MDELPEFGIQWFSDACLGVWYKWTGQDGKGYPLLRPLSRLLLPKPTMETRNRLA